MNTYITIVGFSSIVILSFFFNWISRKTNIPSVLMLIGLGMGIKAVLAANGISGDRFGIDTILEILGNIGLVMIVLEASLDLELKRSKLKLIVRGFLVAGFGFSATLFAIGFLFSYLYPETHFYNCLVNAVPLSILSSAIIIPSISSLSPSKKEFMVYESTFSDIIGIMVFYFMIGAEGATDKTAVALGIGSNILITLLFSVVAAFLLVVFIQRLTMKVKLFLIISLLLLMYSVGKMFHLSSLLLILAFGLVLNNTHLFANGKLRKFFDEKVMKSILHDFHTLTLESAFLIRTFFFVLFGFSIALSSLYSWKVALNSLLIVVAFYLIRYISLRIFSPKNIFPEVFIAPRGLITVLLYFSIMKTKTFAIDGFDPGLLLYPILITSMVMAIGLLTHKGTKVSDALLSQLPRLNLSNESDETEAEQSGEEVK